MEHKQREIGRGREKVRISSAFGDLISARPLVFFPLIVTNSEGSQDCMEHTGIERGGLFGTI